MCCTLFAQASTTRARQMMFGGYRWKYNHKINRPKLHSLPKILRPETVKSFDSQSEWFGRGVDSGKQLDHYLLQETQTRRAFKAMFNIPFVFFQLCTSFCMHCHTQTPILFASTVSMSMLTIRCSEAAPENLMRFGPGICFGNVDVSLHHAALRHHKHREKHSFVSNC